MRIPLNIQPYEQEFAGVRIRFTVDGEISPEKMASLYPGVASLRRAVDDTMTALGMTEEARCVPCGKKAETKHGIKI